MDMEALRLVTVDTYVPIYRFNSEEYKNQNKYGYDLEIPSYSCMRTIKKQHFLRIEIIVRVRDEVSTSNPRNRMVNRVLVRQ